ncbi:MAG: helical backbone metal receptor [Armatimonadota bacterium]|nr:helical backbone metal receptor [Armatimonadota bacterium]
MAAWPAGGSTPDARDASSVNRRCQRLAAYMAVAVVAAYAAAPPVASGGYPLRLVDATGAQITIARRPARVISLAPSVTEILFALGLEHEVVGISDADDFPPERVRGRTRVGGVVLNLERIVALRPDLIIGMPSLQRDQLLRLRSLRLPVLAVDATSVSETIAQIRLLGRVTGRPRDAERLAHAVESRARPRHPPQMPRVYAELWYEPVMAAAAGTLVDDVITRAGGRNVFSDRRGYVQVPLEAVLVRNPQVILLLHGGRAQALARPGWRAVGPIFEVPASLVTRPGPRISDGVAMVARFLGSDR